MYKKGSITVYLSLMMTVLLALIAAALYSAQQAGARMQAVHQTDQTLYSLFARYDQTLLKRYHLFFVDGAFGGADLDAGRIYQLMKRDISAAAGGPPKGGIRLASGEISGYTLATDSGGNAVKAQAVACMEALFGVQGVRSLMDKVRDEEETIHILEQQRAEIDQEEMMERYEEVKQRRELSDMQPEAEETVIPEEYVNPIEAVSEMRHKGVLELVLEEGDELSEAVWPKGATVSGRSLEKGMGVLVYDDACNSSGSELLFNEYLIRFLGSYVEQQPSAGLKYQLEYVIQGKESDIENLRGIANKMFLIREAANLSYLYGNEGKRAQAKAAAMLIATVLLQPEAAEVIEPALLICWAFGESVLDVRSLLKGDKVVLTKDDATWQLAWSRFPEFFGGLDSLRKSYDRGMTYQEYLRMFLLTRGAQEKLNRSMDMIEQGVRGEDGRENFCLDHCVYNLEAQFSFQAAGDIRYQVSRSYGYNMK